MNVKILPLSIHIQVICSILMNTPPPPNTTSCNESRVIRFYDFLQKNPTCEKNWEQYKKSCMVAMQTLQCLKQCNQ